MQTLIYFLIFGGLFLLMMRGGCGSHVMGHGHGGHGDHEHGGSEPQGSAGGQMAPDEVKDPVCGMTIKNTGAKSAVYRGQPYYFCSTTCRDKFEASPATYAQAAAPAPAKEHHHGCC